MASYKDRLNSLKKNWETDKPATGGGQLPPGKYQFAIKRALLEESTASFNKGNIQVTLHLEVVTGQLKGRKHVLRTDIEAKATDKFPSGISRLKGQLEKLSLDLPKDLSEGSLKALLSTMVGIIFNGACVHNAKGYANVYINDLVNSAPESEEDEEESEDDVATQENTEAQADEDDDEDEDEDDDEEEVKKPAPKAAAKPPFKPTPAAAKSPAKPAKKEEKEEDSEDDDWEL